MILEDDVCFGWGIGYGRSIPFSYMEGVCFTAVRRGCGLYNLLSAVQSIDILLSAVGVMLTISGNLSWRGEIF